MVRIFALSDIHVDYDDNMAWITALDPREYHRDILLLAGDVSHRPAKMRQALRLLKERFQEVFFVPGNHDLWLFRNDFEDSIGKFGHLLELCAELGIRTHPMAVGNGDVEDGGKVWVLPLFSWYVKPEEGKESLYMPKEGEDPSLETWADSHFIRWPEFTSVAHAGDYFLRLNEPHLLRSFDAPVISFSHFLPRTELILATPEEDAEAGRAIPDLTRSFNFSRVAGQHGLDGQIRRAGSVIHVYGHQHRNRFRRIDGVRYISHCLGYKTERREGMIRYLDEAPRLIWDGGEV